MYLLSQYLSVFVEHLVLQDHLPADLGAVVDDDVHVGPGAKLSLPVGDGGQWGNDEEGPSNPHVEDLIEKRDGLDCFSQSHLVRQNAVFPGNKQTGSDALSSRGAKDIGKEC